MPRLINISDEGWITIGMRATTRVDDVADPAAWVRNARHILEQISELPEGPILQPGLIQAEEQLAAARPTIERHAI